MTTFNSQISLLTLRCNSFSYSMFYEISLKMKTRHHLVEMHQFVNPLTREMLAMYVSAKLRICCNFTFFLNVAASHFLRFNFQLDFVSTMYLCSG